MSGLKRAPQAVFVGTPRVAGGYGLTPNQQAGSYFSPILGCLLGEFVGRYLNDYIARRGIRKCVEGILLAQQLTEFVLNRNHGVFEPEMRLWTLYFA